MQDDLKNNARLSKQLDRLNLSSIAKSSGWVARSSGKLTPEAFCLALICATQISSASLRLLAFVSGVISSIVVSKQALHKRVNARALTFLEDTLAAAATARAGRGVGATSSRFRRIVLQDSTSVRLPKGMSEAFPASGNESGPTAGMRIHATFDLVSRSFLGFAIRDGCTPDQKHAVEGAAGLGEGDLLVRDLGYFSIEAFSSILAGGLRVITRYKLNLSLFRPKSGVAIDLAKLLRGRRTLDVDVLAGKRHRLPLRMVAFRVPSELAERRRRAFRLTARKKGRTPSRLSLELQGWQILLTNCSSDELEMEQVRELYRQRWGIEILFKAFKTHMRIEQLPARASETLLRCLIVATLIRITLTHAFLLPCVSSTASRAVVSELKLHSICEALCCLPFGSRATERSATLNIMRHILYEKRYNMSLPEKLASLG